MHATSLSPGVLRMVGLAASGFSFAAASDLLWKLAAVRVGTKQVERCAEALGREIADDERAVAETVSSPAATMYFGMDGTGVPVRPAEVEGRRGKQPDGSAKTREVKLATTWTAEGRNKAGRPSARPRVGQLQRRGRERGQPRHRPAAGCLRPTGPSRGNTARFRHRGPSGRHRRRRAVDLICCVHRYVAWSSQVAVESGCNLALRNITDRPHRVRRKAMTSASRFHGEAPCGSG